MFSSPILLALKLFFGGVFEFVKKNWLPVLFVALLLTIWFLYAKLDRVQFEYDQHLVSDAKAMSDRKLENYLKEKAHAKDIEAAHAETIALTEKFNLDRKRYTKEIKDLYDVKTNSTYRLNSYADWMRLEQERKAAAGLPTPDTYKQELAEGWKNCDAANSRLQEQYKILEGACVITTLDYNEIRVWGDSVCELVGCK
jgi:CRISPR/Cas system CMR-associated protein Cmr5 small subunit